MKREKLIRGWLQQTGMKQRDLAELIGVTEPTISRLLKGTRNLGWQKAKLLANHMGVPMERLYQ